MLNINNKASSHLWEEASVYIDLNPPVYTDLKGVTEMRKPGFSRKPAKTWRKPTKTCENLPKPLADKDEHENV